MKAQIGAIETKQDSRLPWRVQRNADINSTLDVWTRWDDTPGSRNNYAVAEFIQDENDALLIACAPGLLSALESVLRHLVTPAGFPDKGKGRTEQQQAIFDQARSIIARAKGES